MVSDLDDTDMQSATITLTNRPDGNSELLAVDTTGTSIVATTYDTATGTITLTGDATIADYQTVLRTVTYQNTAAPPNSADRLINIKVNGGGLDSNTAVATVDVPPLNTPPEVDLNGAGTAGLDTSASFTEDSPAVAIAPNGEMSDADDANLESLTVTLTNRPDGVAESLSANVSGTSILVDAYVSSTGVLFLHGTDTIANYQQVLRTVTYNNSDDTPDPATRSITVGANDGQGASNTATSSISVAPQNDAPTATDQSVTTNEDTDKAVTLSGTDPENDTLTFTYNQPSHGTVDGTAPNVTYHPAANYSGPDSFTFTADDGNGGTDGGMISITVGAVNDAPSFTKGADQTVNEDAGAQTVNPWATGISPGPGETDAVTFNVANNNNALFTGGGQPAVSPAGVLTYTPAANAHGTATVTVSLTDDAGTPGVLADDLTSADQTFVITVNAVNDQPTLDTIADQTVLEDSGASNVSLTGISGGPADESAQTVTVTASSSDTAIVPNPTVGAVSGGGATLTFTPAANAFGTVTITVTAQDNGGMANGGVDTRTRTFTITVDRSKRSADLHRGRQRDRERRQRRLFADLGDGDQRRARTRPARS